ncbi:MAG: potassium-transporting ATPase subunit KdpA [Bacteroidales bacterium]|jgi:K+-transporting ATPase ATPase A chain
MHESDLVQVALFILILVILTPLLGRYMAKVFLNEKHILKPLLLPFENLIYRFISCDGSEMNWKSYAVSLLVFNFFGFIVLFLLQLFQNFLPLNPQKLPGVGWPLAFNTAVSFMTNTNWQSYSGETTLSYLVQMAGLTVQNFLSAATGITVFLALMRGLTRKTAETVGNFWMDTVRSVLYVLLPLSIILAIILAGQGVVQTFHPYVKITTLQGQMQTIPLGPVSSQIAIKQLGTNGGGFFNVNSAHPFENPTPLTNFLEMLAILLIPSALTFTYGRMAGSNRQGWTLFLVMLAFLIFGLVVSFHYEYTLHAIPGLSTNMEGKETRFGIGNSVLWTVATTAASNGSVNSMIDSYSPMAGFAAMSNIMVGEVIFGGVGAGIYGMVMFIILTVFIAGLMVGRSPEFLGKKIEAFEVEMAIIAVLATNFVILVFSAIGSITKAGLAGINNPGPHGLSEILYAFTSAAGNNGSAFAGINANTMFYNILIGVGMLIGRYGVIIPALAIAGSMVHKKITPVSAGTFRTDTWLFGLLLISVIVIIGGLTFFPALSFGPIVEHLMMSK